MADDVDVVYPHAWENLTTAVGTPTCVVCMSAVWQYAGTLPTGEALPPARFCCTTCGYTLVFDGIMLMTHHPGPDRPPPRRPSAA